MCGIMGIPAKPAALGRGDYEQIMNKVLRQIKNPLSYLEEVLILFANVV